MCEIPNFNFELTNEEKISFNSNAGKIIASKKEQYDIKNIEVIVSDEIHVKYEIENFEEIKLNKNYNIEFKYNNWLITVLNSNLTKITSLITTTAENIICKKGQRKNNSIVKRYYFIENLNINEQEITKIKNIPGLKFIKRKYNLFPNVDGYFYIETRLNERQDLVETLKQLLKFYSANAANMRISYIHSKDNSYTELNFGCISKYAKLNIKNDFYDGYPFNFTNFINSTCANYEKNEFDINLKYLIENLVALNREEFIEVKVIVNCMILEILKKNNIPIDKSAKMDFILKLKALMLKLDLNNDYMNEFFKSKGLCCENYLSEIYEIRKQVMHGKSIDSEKIELLLNTFILILVLRLLNVDCIMHIPILNKNKNTKEFINKFLNDKNIVEVVKINDKYYLPLQIDGEEIEYLKEFEKFEVIEFKSKDYLDFRIIDSD